MSSLSQEREAPFALPAAISPREPCPLGPARKDPGLVPAPSRKAPIGPLFRHGLRQPCTRVSRSQTLSFSGHGLRVLEGVVDEYDLASRGGQQRGRDRGSEAAVAVHPGLGVR